ncbi:MAG: hypothetical protein IIY62_05370 [Kiritimatiellae bacterium]|nr:hypothetical protein [Kiritimatiellia bacterium]
MRAFAGIFAAVAAFAACAVFADGEQQKVDDLERKIREMEERIAQANKKAEDAAAQARELGARAEEFKRTAGERGRVFNDQRGRADRERRRLDGNVRTADDAKRRIPELEKKVAERKASVKSLEDLRRTTVNEEQVEKLRRATKAQEDIAARIALLRKILENDEPEQQKLVQENRPENALVTKDATTMKMVDAFELAKQIETAITESYKDIKATQTAIERKMSFEAAQKITDVAKAVRIEANREALEDNPRTKEALDAQKVAQTEVVRETDNIVETVVAMMQEALEIVKPDDGSKAEIKGVHPKVVQWLQEKDFEKRAQEEEQQKRLEQMAAVADYQVAITAAAAENEEERAKDLTKVAENAEEVKKNTESADVQTAPAGAEQAHFRDAGTLARLDAKMPELVGGNVIRFTESGLKDGIPAKWMYVQDWYVIGPFPNPDRVNLRRKFPPESVVDLDATYVGKDGRTIKWEFMQTRNSTPKESWRSDGKAEIVPYNAEEYGIWYAYAEVFADTACDRWIAVGSDDRSDIWVNDAPVWGSSNKLKTWRIDEGYRRIHLNKGRNRILARIENGWHALGWSVCISLEDGQLGE